MTAVILQSFIFIGYILYYTLRAKRILPSISDSWYFLGKKNGHYFQVFTFILGISTWLHLAGPFVIASKVLLVLAAPFMASVGMAPEFNSKNGDKIKIIHYGGAFVMIACCSIAACITAPALWVGFGIALLATIILTCLPIHTKIFFIEVVWFVFIITGFTYIYLW